MIFQIYVAGRSLRATKNAAFLETTPNFGPHIIVQRFHHKTYLNDCEHYYSYLRIFAKFILKCISKIRISNDLVKNKTVMTSLVNHTYFGSLKRVCPQ